MERSSPEEASWKNYDLLQGQFPTFRLVFDDKLFFKESSIDTYRRPLQVYTRRKKYSRDKEEQFVVD